VRFAMILSCEPTKVIILKHSHSAI
jgi:hypothetical protein